MIKQWFMRLRTIDLRAWSAKAWAALAVFVLLASALLGLATGIVRAQAVRARQQNLEAATSAVMQFTLGMDDLAAKNYAQALERFKYVARVMPDFPGLVEALTQAEIGLATAPQPDQPLESSEPVIEIEEQVLDLGPIEEQFGIAQGHIQARNWSEALRTLVSIRNIDPFYRVAEMDRMVFLVLRMRAVEMITVTGQLETGTYLLALVDQFAPIDVEARQFMQWAQYYLYGQGYWGLDWEKSVLNFGLISRISPFMHDGNGNYAIDRYKQALAHWSADLAKKADWCTAAGVINTYWQNNLDEGSEEAARYANEQCALTGGGTPDPNQLPTETPTLDLTISATPTVTGEATTAFTPTPTDFPPSATPEPSPTSGP